jgi:hypothetical protein
MKKILFIGAAVTALAGPALAQELQLIDTENGDCVVAENGEVALVDGTCENHVDGVDVEEVTDAPAGARLTEEPDNEGEFEQPEEESSSS